MTKAANDGDESRKLVMKSTVDDEPPPLKGLGVRIAPDGTETDLPRRALRP